MSLSGCLIYPGFDLVEPGEDIVIKEAFKSFLLDPRINIFNQWFWEFVRIHNYDH